MKKVLIGLAVIAVLIFGFFFYASNTPSTMVVEHTFNAPIEKVWAIWNDPEMMKQWWSPKDFTAPVIKNDFRLGGTFLLSMKAPDGKMFWNTGSYLEIDPQKKIVSSMAFSDENGRAVTADHYGIPGKWPDTVIVTVDFNDVGGKTMVRVRESGIPLVMKLMAKIGWEQQFDKFETLLK